MVKQNTNYTEKGVELEGVLLAAGRGVRAYPSTKYVPKSLLEVGGKPLILRNVEILRDQLNIKKINIVIGYLGEQIIEYFQSLSLGVEIHFVEQSEQKGIGHALLTVEHKLQTEKFVVILADELYLDSKHGSLLKKASSKYEGILCFIEENEKEKYLKNYTAEIKDLLRCGYDIFSQYVCKTSSRHSACAKHISIG